MLDLFDETKEELEHNLDCLQKKLANPELSLVLRERLKFDLRVTQDKLDCYNKPGLRSKPLEVVYMGKEHYQLVVLRARRLNLGTDWINARIHQSGATVTMRGDRPELQKWHRDSFFAIMEELYQMELYVHRNVDPKFKLGGNPKMMDLFDEVLEEATDKDTGEVQLPDSTAASTAGSPSTPAPGSTVKDLADNREAYLDELRKEMGYHQYERKVDTREFAEKLLRTRQMVMLELAYISAEYTRIKQKLESSLETWENDWSKALAEWDEAHPPEKGKTSLECLYGKLYRRDQPASWSKDDELDPKQELLKGQVVMLYKRLGPEKAAKAGIVPYTDYKFDLTQLKEIADAQEADKLGKKAFPGLRYTPYVKNKFSIGPSFETFKDKWKEARKK